MKKQTLLSGLSAVSLALILAGIGCGHATPLPEGDSSAVDDSMAQDDSMAGTDATNTAAYEEAIANSDWALTQGGGVLYGDTPDEWTRDDSMSPTTDAFFASPADGPSDPFRENINIVSEDISGYNLTSDDYTDLNIKGIENNMSDVVIADSDKKDMTIAGNVPAVKVTYTTATFGGEDLEFQQVFFVLGDYGYTITYTALPDTFNRYLPAFDSFLSGVQGEAF